MEVSRALCTLLLWLASLAVARNSSAQLGPPASPCPLVFRYEPSPSAATGWIGVVRLVAPPKFSGVHVRVVFAAPQRLHDEPGTLSLRGGVAAARALVRATQQGHREAIEFVAEFPCATTAVPSLLNVTANGRVFCSSTTEPADTKSTISLEAQLETGFNTTTPGDEDFGVDTGDVSARPLGQNDPPARLCAPAASAYDPARSQNDQDFAPPPPSPSVVNLPAVSRPPSSLPAYPAPPLAAPPRAPPPPPPPEQVVGTGRPAPNDECGRPWGANLLVTRGSAAARGRWPWLVALFKKLGRRDQLGLNFECGATLVSRKHVTTAAHCVELRRGRTVDPAALVAYLGKHDLLSYTEPGQLTAEVAEVRMHPDYGRDLPYANDIAILQLADAVEPTMHIRPVCLWPSGSAADDDSVVGKIGAVPGWGKDDSGAISNEIRVANMPIVSQETCLRSNVFYLSFTSNSTFCAGFRNGTSVCNGDSGGGLFIREPDGRWRIRGIVSVSMFSVNEQSCDSYNYAVFTDVAKYLPWLHEQMSK